MTEMWDIARYVEDNPEDLDQRWRLAKKLYMAWEYRLALEHLQILRNEWPDHLNIVRYLAATYYRLGRYDDAIEELNIAIAEWPGEIGLREQLARVLEIAGQREQSAKVWEEIATMDQHHPFAKSAVQRLRDPSDEKTDDDLRLEDSDSGIDLSPGTVCPNCGAQNSSEFDRCWQCHAHLFTPQDRLNTPRPAQRAGAGLSPAAQTMALGLAASAFSILAIILAIRLIIEADSQTIPGSLTDIYENHLLATRLWAGIALVGFWTGGLWTGLALVKGAEDPPPAIINLAGLLLGALTFVASWLPGWLWYLVFLLPAVIAFGLLILSLRLRLIRAMGVWLVAQLTVTAGLTGTVLMSERSQLGAFFNPFSEVPAIIAYAAQQSPAQTGEHLFSQGAIPYSRDFALRSTGSQWLDLRAGNALFTVYTEAAPQDLHFELKDPTGTLLYVPLDAASWSREIETQPGRRYQVVVATPTGGEGAARLGLTSLFLVE